MTTANIKISQMPPLTTMGNATIFPVVDAGSNKSVSGTVLRNFLANVSGTGNTLVNGSYTVSLEADGTTTFPTGGHIGATKGGTMLDAGYGYNTSLTTFYANANYAACVTGDAGTGTLRITAYNDGGPDPASEWAFANDGILTFPSGMTMGNIQGSEGIWGSANVQIGTLSQGISGASVLEWVDDLEDATSVAAVAVNSVFAANTGAVQIITGAAGPTPEYMWTFDANGDLTVAKDIVVGTNDGHIYIDQDLSSATSIRWVNVLSKSEMFRVYSDSRQDINNELFQAGFDPIDNPGFYITTTANVSGNVSGIGNNPADDHTWTFRTDGGLRFPDGSVQTTAYTGDSTVWVQDFETTSGAPLDVVGMATAVEYLANGDIVALFDHRDQNPGSSRYSSVGRFSPNGTKLWNMRFSGSQYTDGWGMAVDNVDGFIYVAGRTDASAQPYAAATLTKFDQVSGAPVWSKIYNAGYDNVNTVVDVAADGNVVVVGYSSNGTDDQIATTKIDKSNGSVVWSRTLDGQGNEEAYGMAVGPAGEVVAVGYMDHTEYPGPVRTILTLTAVPASDPAWTNDLLGVTVGGVSYDITFTAGVPTFSNIVDTTGNYYVGDQLSLILGSQIGGGANMQVNVATTTQEDVSRHILVVKYDSSGTIQWQRAVQVEAGFDCKGADADIDSSGNIYVCGTFDYNDGLSKNAMIIIKFDSSGVKQWSRKVVGGCDDSATSIVVGPDDCLYLSAVTSNFGTGDFSLVVAKYNLNGTVAWQRLLDNTTTWTFGGHFWFNIGGGSNLAVREGYVAVAGGYADPFGPPDTVPHAIVAQFDAAGTVFATGDYDFRAASFSGFLDSSASNITVTDADKTASNYEFAGVDPFNLNINNSNFLVGTLYPSGIGSTVSQLTNGGYTVTLQGDGSLLIPTGDADNTARGQIFSDNESSFINLDVQFSSDIMGGMRLGTDGPKPVDIVTNASNSNHKWRFGADGNLTLPHGSTIADTASAPGTGNGQAIEIKPGGAVNANQLLRIYPTAPNPDGNHLHLTSGDLSVTDLFLGDDYQFVQIAADGNVCIGTDSAKYNYIWQFGTDGNLTLPGGGTILDTVPTPGITRTKYTGSAEYDVNWYSTAAVIETGIVTSISEGYDDTLVDGADYSFQYVGYFKAPVTGNYTFAMFADDSGRFWIGPNALTGYTAVNANISIPMYASGNTTTSLTADEFYPIRLQWNNASGPGSVAFTWSNDQGQAGTSLLDGVVFADLGQTAITSDNDIELRINNGTVSTWQFGTTGNLTLPVDGVIKNSDGSIYGGGGFANYDEDGTTYNTVGVGNQLAYGANVWVSADGGLAMVGGTTVRMITDDVGGSAWITTGDPSLYGGIPSPMGGGHNWQFGTDGTLTTPGSIIGPADAFFNIKVTDSGPGASLQLGDWDIAGFPKSLVQISNNVHIVTGVTTGGGDWTFDTNGTLTVPGDIVAQEGNDINVIVYNPTVEGTPGGVTFSVQNCDVESGHKTTQFDVGPSDIVLTTDFSGTKNEWTFGANGNLTLPGQGKIVPGSQTMLKATESAGIVSLMGYSGDTGINVNDTDGVDVLTNNGSDHNWNFGTDGTTAFPDNKIKQQANTNLRIETRLDYNVATLVDGNSGYNDWAPGTVIGAATTNFNGHGSGMTVDITTVNIGEFNGVVVSVVVNNPGTGYQNGDLIYILGGNNGATFTIGNYSSTLSDTTSTWTFGSDGNLTLPANCTIKNTSGTVYKVAPTYGSFYSNITQTNTSVGDAIAISYNVTDLSNGVSITGAGATEIRIAAAGVYNIQFSLQVRKTDSGADTIYVWLDKNGNTVDNSATNLNLVGSGAAEVAAWNFVVNAAANDYYRLMWMSTDSHVEIVTVTAGAVVPAIPSVILTVVPVGA